MTENLISGLYFQLEEWNGESAKGTGREVNARGDMTGGEVSGRGEVGGERGARRHAGPAPTRLAAPRPRRTDNTLG